MMYEKFRNQVYSHNSSIDIATAQLEIDEDFNHYQANLNVEDREYISGTTGGSNSGSGGGDIRRPSSAYPWDNRIATQLHHSDHRHLPQQQSKDQPLPSSRPLSQLPPPSHINYSDLFDHNRGRNIDRSRSPHFIL